ncbi:MAG TPA: MFS transporter [Actinomycetota bacterium]|nr:MFS transporter [Actinomycetota bacterium]
MTDEIDPPEFEDALPPPAPPEARHPGWVGRFRGHGIDLTPLRVSADFRHLFVGQAISEFGTQITFVAVPFQVYEITGSTAMVGLLALTEVLPLVVLPIVGGAIADAVERRRFLMIAQGAVAALSVALAVNAFLSDPRVWVLFAFSFLWASAYSIYSPAFRAWPARLLTPDLFTSALALEVVYYQSAAIAGPILAGLLIHAYGVGWAYLLDAVSYLAVILALTGMRPSPPTAERLSIGWSAIREGLRFLRGKQVLQGTFFIDLIAMIFGIPVALYPAFVLDVLGRSVAALGFLYAAEALGSLLIALFSGRAKHVRRQGLVTIVACMCWGAGIVGFGFSSTLGVAMLFLMLASAADMVSGLYRDAIMKTVTPDEMRGRMEGVSLAVVGTGPSLGNAEAGLLASLTSVRTSIVSGGIACIVGAGVLGLLLPRYRRYDARRPSP